MLGGFRVARMESEFLQVHERDANGIGDSSRQRRAEVFGGVDMGTTAGEWVWLALACDEILLVDDRSECGEYCQRRRC